MNSANASRASYVWGVPAILLALLVAAAMRLPLPELTGGLLLAATIWLLLIGLAEATPIDLAGRGSRARLTAIFDFGALLCFAVVPAALMVTVADPLLGSTTVPNRRSVFFVTVMGRRIVTVAVPVSLAASAAVALNIRAASAHPIITLIVSPCGTASPPNSYDARYAGECRENLLSAIAEQRPSGG